MKIRTNKIFEFLLWISPFFLLFSPVESFSIISLSPLIAVSVFFLFGNKISVKLDSNNIFLFLLIAWLLISNVFNYFRYLSIASFYSYTSFIYIIGILIWFCLNTNSILSKYDIRKQIFSYNLVSIIVSIQMIYFSISGTPGKIRFLNFWGIYMDENYITAILAVSGVYSFIALLFDRNTKKATIFNVLCLFSTIAAVAIGGSRASFIALLLGLFITFFYYMIRDFSIKKIFAMIMIVLIVVVVVFVLKNIMSAWILERYFDTSGYNDYSNNLRLLIWETAVKGILKHPFVGFGMGAYTEMDEHRFLFNLIDRGTPAHQTILDFGIFGGITAIVLFLAFLSSIFLPILRNKEARKYAGVVFVLVFISMIVSATKSVFLWNNLIYLKLILMNNQNKNLTK